MTPVTFLSWLSLGLEHHHAQRWDRQLDRIRSAVPGDLFGHAARVVAQVAAAVEAGIAAEDFVVPDQLRHAQAMRAARNGREIAKRDDVIAGMFRLADEAERAFFPVVAVDPLEALVVEVDLVQSWLSPIDVVQVADALLQALVRF